MALKVKIIDIYIYYLMYKHLYNMTLNLDVAFHSSVSIYKRKDCILVILLEQRLITYKRILPQILLPMYNCTKLMPAS